MSLVEDVLSSKSKIRLLRIFYDNPRKEFLLTDLTRILGSSTGTIHPSLSSLLDSRILTSRKIGISTFYKLNYKNPLVKKIMEIFSAEETLLLNTAKDFTRKLDKTDIISIILFGSVARGKATERSDVDILVIYDKNIEKIKKAVDRLVDEYLERDTTITPVIYSLEEIKKMKKTYNTFILRVEDEGKVLFGKSLKEIKS